MKFFSQQSSKVLKMAQFRTFYSCLVAAFRSFPQYFPLGAPVNSGVNSQQLLFNWYSNSLLRYLLFYKLLRIAVISSINISPSQDCFCSSDNVSIFKLF